MKHISLIISSFLLCYVISGCVKDPEMGTDVKNAKAPTINTLLDEQLHPIIKTATTIQFDAEVVSANGVPVESYGVCWSTEPGATIENSDTTVCGKGVELFQGVAKGLLPEKDYYIRPYATNAKGTSYGEEFHATTSKWSGVVKTVVLADSIKAESVYCGGKIAMHGEGEVKERGVYLTTPTKKDSVIPMPIDADSFVCKVSKLQLTTEYTVCAYVTNEFGTYKGEPVTFSTTDGKAILNTPKEQNIGYTNISIEAEVKSEGDVPVVARGFCWGTVAGVTVETGDTTVNESGKGVFTATINKLASATEYYIRAYATNAYGTAYSEEISFWTKSATPRLSAVAITGTNTGGTLNVVAEVLDEGETEVTESGVSYSLTPNDKSGNTKVPFASGKGKYNGTLANLKGGVTYYIKAYAINKKGTVTYGEESSYKTPNLFTTKQAFPGANKLGNSVATAVMDKNGFILGGDTGPEKTNELWAYRADRNEWIQLDSYPEKLKWQTAVNIGFAIVTFGGNKDNSTDMNELYVYSTFTNYWEKINASSSPAARSQAAGFEHNGEMYLIGGRTEGDVTNEIWHIEPKQGANWKKETTGFPVPQCGGIAVTIGDKVYAGLGVDKSNVCNKRLWVSSTDLLQGWTELSSINSNVRCGIAYEGNIYIVDDSGYIWKYDVAADQWARKSQMPAGNRDIYCMYSLNGLIYMTQGTTDSPIISYDPSWDN